MSELQVYPAHLKSRHRVLQGSTDHPEAQSRRINLAGLGNAYLVLTCPALAHGHNPISIFVIVEANPVTSSPDAFA